MAEKKDVSSEKLGARGCSDLFAAFSVYAAGIFAGGVHLNQDEWMMAATDFALSYSLAHLLSSEGGARIKVLLCSFMTVVLREIAQHIETPNDYSSANYLIFALLALETARTVYGQTKNQRS